MSERKYPCEAVIVNLEPPEGFDAFVNGETQVTVLAPAKLHDCCCEYTHPIEFPDGFPEPPERCSTWMVKPSCLEFVE